MKFRKLNFSESINEAMILSMKRDKNIICWRGGDEKNSKSIKFGTKGMDNRELVTVHRV